GGQGADREEKRVTCGTARKKVQEHLDLNHPKSEKALKSRVFELSSSPGTSISFAALGSSMFEWQRLATISNNF
ncbi:MULTISPECIES: hypothetical protein, partial [unclassified Mesorhizobium]|uniref:hypothetical protein n=1 Tax=unclassified Mesorhizobium TaxID=325217 RepID=UPI001AEC11EE